MKDVVVKCPCISGLGLLMGEDVAEGRVILECGGMKFLAVHMEMVSNHYKSFRTQEVYIIELEGKIINVTACRCALIPGNHSCEPSWEYVQIDVRNGKQVLFQFGRSLCHRVRRLSLSYVRELGHTNMRRIEVCLRRNSLMGV